jgi:tetratricopeptide (TPR) repeat protein
MASMVSDAISVGDNGLALAIAEVAVSSAEGVPERAYRKIILAQLRGHAWVIYAAALLSVGRLTEALQATEEAYVRLTGSTALAYDRAAVGLVRAQVLNRMGRCDEAIDVLAKTKRVFLDHGDNRRAALAEDLGRGWTLRV